MEEYKFDAPLWLQVPAKWCKCQPDQEQDVREIRLCSVTRETEGNQLPPLIARGSSFFQAVSHNLDLGFLDTIPEKVDVSWAGVASCRISTVRACLKPRGTLLWALSFAVWPHDYVQ